MGPLNNDYKKSYNYTESSEEASTKLAKNNESCKMC